MMKEEESKMAIKSEAMFIDLGFKDKKAVESAGVRVGDWISFDRDTVKCGTRITGKAFDNRIGCAVLIELMKKISPKCEVYGVFTAQEETGLKGARVSAFGIDPHIALAIDTDLVGDTPGLTPEDCSAGLGKGPVITISDGGRGGSTGSGLMTSRKIIDWLEDSAKKAKIKYQLLVSSGGTTDATIIALNRSGVPTGTLGIPTRYLHTPVQVLDLDDAKDMVKLVESAVNNLPNL
jgi:endoglucanase